MSRMIFYTVLIGVLAAWTIGTFYLKEEGYIHSLLVIAGLMWTFKYVYHLKPATT